MTRQEYLQQVIEGYLDSPDTPAKARQRDWAIAGSFYQRKIPLETILHAIRLATLRRHRRDPELEQLEPVHSLAYFRPLIDHILREPHELGYVQYTKWSYETRLDWPFEDDGAEKCG